MTRKRKTISINKGPVSITSQAHFILNNHRKPFLSQTDYRSANTIKFSLKKKSMQNTTTNAARLIGSNNLGASDSNEFQKSRQQLHSLQ